MFSNHFGNSGGVVFGMTCYINNCTDDYGDTAIILEFNIYKMVNHIIMLVAVVKYSLV